jgi:hypothetical protein
MKLCLIFSLLIFFILLKHFDASSSPLSTAFKDLTNKIFTNESFDIILYGDPTDYSKKAMDQFLSQKNSTVNLMHLNEINETEIIKWTRLEPAIFIIRTIQQAKTFFNNFRLPIKTQPKNYKFLIFIEEIKDEKFLNEIPREKLTRKFPHLSHHSFYIVESSRKVQLFTLSPFRENACENYEYVEVGSFSKNKKIWNKLKIEEKFKKFHKCLVIWRASILSPKSWNPFINDFLNIVAEKGNLTPFVQWDLPSSEFVPKDGKTLKYHADFIVTPLIATSWKMIHVTSTFGEVFYVFVLTPGAKYSSYEKMLLPFDPDTWMFLSITFSVAFCVVFALKIMPRKLRNNVVGSRVTQPSYNIMGTFFGISQHKTPKENSARILLIFFIFFCLIFRTAYQSVLFEMMTTDMRKELPTTIDGLYEKHFKIVLFTDDLSPDYQILTRMIREDRRPELLNITASEFNGDKKFVSYYLDNIENDSAKLAFFMTDHLERTLASEFQIDGVQLEEKLFSTTFGFGYRKNCFIIYLVDEVVKNLITTGIMQKLWKDTLPREYQAPEKVPNVLSVGDLKFGFVVWLTAAITSLITFLMEFVAFKVLRKIKFYLRRKLKEIIGKFLVLKHLKKLYFERS